MHCAKAILILAAVCHTAAGAEPFQGAKALAWTRQVAELGPRPSGSPAHARMQALIVAELHRLNWEVEEDAFTADTPAGRIPMKNIIARKPGSSGRAIVVSGHYDTKRLPAFVGANDGGSSTGFLLEMARVFASGSRSDDLYLVWFDGEEAIGSWTATDSLYGSRHLAERWARQGKLARIKALINVDMIGDRDLGILEEEFSSPSLIRLVWAIARDLGHGKHFLPMRGAVEDDHVPFARRGVPAIDLIDFDYGPGNRWWHTVEDTMDKLSEASFQAVGDVVRETVLRLERKP